MAANREWLEQQETPQKLRNATRLVAAQQQRRRRRRERMDPSRE
jgi:hypothetical protein